MIKVKHINNESGMALVIALVMLLALTVIGITSITTSTLDIQLSSNERRAAETLNLADAGIERALHDLLYDFKHDSTSTKWANTNLYRLSLDSGSMVTDSIGAATGNVGCSPKPSCIDSQFGTPFANDGITGGIGNSVDMYVDTETLGDGKYRVLVLRDASEPDEIYVRSYAENSTGARKILQLHLGLNTVDAWRNALFAGRGSATAAITGNINIAGSVHILGTGAQNDMTISGASSVKNGYKDLAADIKARLLMDPGSLCTDCGLEVLGTYNGKDVYSLETVFRIKNVQTAVTGSGNIGEAASSIDTEGDDPGGGAYEVSDGNGNGYDNLYYDPDLDVYFKSSIDAVYTNKNIDLSDPAKQLFSDKPEAAYDLGDKIQMPRLEDPYDPVIHTNRNGESCSDLGLSCPNYKQFIEQVSTEFDASTLLDTDGASASCRLTTSAVTGSTNPTANFQYGTMTCTDPNDVTTCTCTDANGCIKWVNNAGTDASGYQKPQLWVDGKVEVKGCPSGFNITGQTAVTYTGKGIIYSTNNVSFGKSFLNYKANKFLENDLMAVMTSGNMRMATETQQTYMGAFYAGGTLGTDFPGSIVGAMMANLFCMSTDVVLSTGLCARENASSGNAADIYYTPGISDELTKLGMLKGRQVFTFDYYDWKQIY